MKKVPHLQTKANGAGIVSLQLASFKLQLFEHPHFSPDVAPTLPPWKSFKANDIHT